MTCCVPTVPFALASSNASYTPGSSSGAGSCHSASSSPVAAVAAASTAATAADMYQPYSASPYLPAQPPAPHSLSYAAQSFDARLHSDPADGDRGLVSAASAALGQHSLDHVHHSKKFKLEPYGSAPDPSYGGMSLPGLQPPQPHLRVSPQPRRTPSSASPSARLCPGTPSSRPGSAGNASSRMMESARAASTDSQQQHQLTIAEDDDREDDDDGGGGLDGAGEDRGGRRRHRGRLQILSDRLFFNIFYDGDTNAALQEHFDKSRSGQAQFNYNGEKVTPMNERLLPASFWDANHSGMSAASMAASAAAAAAVCRQSYADLYSADLGGGLTGALHQLAAASSVDWPQYHAGASTSGQQYSSRSHYNYPSTAAGYWAAAAASRLAAAGHMKDWSGASPGAGGINGGEYQHQHHQHHQAAAAAAVLQQNHGDFSHHYAHPYSNMTGLDGGGMQEVGKDSYWHSSF